MSWDECMCGQECVKPCIYMMIRKQDECTKVQLHKESNEISNNPVPSVNVPSVMPRDTDDELHRP